MVEIYTILILETKNSRAQFSIVFLLLAQCGCNLQAPRKTLYSGFMDTYTSFTVNYDFFARNNETRYCFDVFSLKFVFI